MNKQNVCVFCKEQMVKAHIEMEDGFMQAWLCDCHSDEYEMIDPAVLV